MKKYLLSFFVIVASAVYALSRYLGSAATNTLSPTTQNPGNPYAAQLPPASSSSGQLISGTIGSGSTVALPSPTPRPSPVSVPLPPAQSPLPTPTPKPRGQYTDGTYVGSLADAYYGMVQVQASIRNGKIASVEFLQYPNDRRTSQYINGRAMPILKSEAIQTQSANVDIVSGATDTSMAFQQSLADALAQAKI
jgi:uncharacterized protein with FMN-binding domain